MTILCPRVNLFLKTAVHAAFRVFRKVFSRLLRMGDCLWRFFCAGVLSALWQGRLVLLSRHYCTRHPNLAAAFQGLFYARRINMQNKNKNVTFFEKIFSRNFHKFFSRQNAAKMQQEYSKNAAKSETEGLASKLIAILCIISYKFFCPLLHSHI